jgi:hypothetical protein
VILSAAESGSEGKDQEFFSLPGLFHNNGDSVTHLFRFRKESGIFFQWMPRYIHKNTGNEARWTRAVPFQKAEITGPDPNLRVIRT